MNSEDPWQNRDVGVWPPPPTLAEPPPAPKPPAMKVWKAIAGCTLASAVISGGLFVAIMIVRIIGGFGAAAGAAAGYWLIAAPLVSGLATAFVWRRGNMSRWRRLACMSTSIALLCTIVGLAVYVISRERHGRETLGWTVGVFVYITLVELIGLGVMGAILRRRDARRASEMAGVRPMNWPPAPGAGDVIPTSMTWRPSGAGGPQDTVPPVQAWPSPNTAGAQPPDGPGTTVPPVEPRP